MVHVRVSWSLCQKINSTDEMSSLNNTYYTKRLCPEMKCQVEMTLCQKNIELNKRFSDLNQNTKCSARTSLFPNDVMSFHSNALFG